MFVAAHVQTALQLVQSYKGEMPFTNFLKQYFSEHKKHGSRDRKQISQLCFSYFRLGTALAGRSAEQRMYAGLFLSSSEPNALLKSLRPEWNEKAAASIAEKCTLLDCLPKELTIFPWKYALSTGIDPDTFALSHLQQPDLFVRMRPGYEKKIVTTLAQLQVDFELVGEMAVRLPSGFKVETYFAINKELVVQDLSSQRVGELMKVVREQNSANQSPKIWDCCAASGGKTIMAFDLFRLAKFTVSDLRESILRNLEERFKQAGIQQYTRLIADLTWEDIPLNGQDFIIADVPCSGSGTWRRSPERLSCFNASEITTYSQLQRNIIENLVPKLNTGGWLLYITCSAFSAENEANTKYFAENFPLEIRSQTMLNGTKERADTMFAALFKKK